MFLIYILIILFLMLISYDIILAFFPQKVIEGLENESNTSSTQDYKPYNLNDPNNSLILAQQNAGNIEVLKGRIDNLDGVKQKVDDIQQNINSMQTQVDGLVQQQSDYAQQLAGSTPADVTGTESNTTANVEASIEEENK
jgi:hypothetical protein